MRTDVDLQPGSRLAGYRVERLLGRGGMGVVYLADDLRLGRKVALKLLIPELAEDTRFRERFLIESKLAASLDHENVIPIYEAGEHDGTLYIAMRYVEGTDLSTLLREHGALEPARTVAILHQVAAALDAAHARGLVHRDVKPSNILLAANEHAYLADFGLTRSLDNPGPTADYAASLGTVDYVAPEQIDGTETGASADVYSLGCVLHECLTGGPPYQASSPMGTLWDHLQADPPSAHHARPDLPQAIDSVIARALAKHPADRHPTCRDLIDDARGALGLHPRPRRRIALLAAVLAAVAVALVAVLLTRDGKSAPSTKPTVAITVDSLQRIDPTTNRLAATMAGLSGPSAVSVGEGAVWVSNQEGAVLSRFDPTTNSESGSVAIGSGARNVFAAAGAVWVIGDQADMTRLDPSDGRVLQRLSAQDTGGAIALAYGDGALFGAIFCPCGLDFVAADQPGVVRIPYPTNLDLTVRVGILQSELPTTKPTGIAVGGGSVWVTSDEVVFSELVRLETGSISRVAARIRIEGGASSVAYGEGGVWVANPYDDTVSRIDPARNRVVARIRVGDDPIALAVGDGSVWVVNHGDGTVSRIDPATGNVVATIPVGPQPNHIAVGERGVWVTVNAA